MPSDPQQVPLQQEAHGRQLPIHSYPPSFFTFAVPAPRHDVHSSCQAADGDTRLHARPSNLLPALVQATSEAPKSGLSPSVAYSNASQAIISAGAGQPTSRHVDQPPPLKQPKNPARQAPVPWPKVQTSPPDDEPNGVSKKSIVQQQQPTHQVDIAVEREPPREAKRPLSVSPQDLLALATSALAAGHKDNGRTESRGRADAELQKLSPPPQPVWDKDDELSSHRKAERIKRRKIEQWAREVRQQAQREHLAADASETSAKSIVQHKGSRHELNEADESKLPASTTPTYGPAFGATFGDLYGGRGKLFAGATDLGPTNTQSDGMLDCLYLNPFYGLVDSSQLSKEALDAQNALYAYRQRKERDHQSSKLKECVSSEAHAPQSADSRPSSGFATRKRTDQVRLDPDEVHVARQRSKVPVAANSDEEQESRQGLHPDDWRRPVVDEGATQSVTKPDFTRHKRRTELPDNLRDQDGASDDLAGSWELPRPFDYRRAVKRHVVKNSVSGTLPPPASARILTADEALQFLEEGRARASAEDTQLQDLSMEDVVHKPAGVQQTERVTSLGNSTITASHPAHSSSSRHLEAHQHSSVTRLPHAHYLDEQKTCAHENSIEMFYYEPERPQVPNDSAPAAGSRVRRHAAEVMLASGDVSLHLTPAEDMEVDVSSEHQSDRGGQLVVNPLWHERKCNREGRDSRHIHGNQHTTDQGPSAHAVSANRSNSVTSSPQDRSGFSHPLGSTPAVSIRPPPEDPVNPEDRYRPRPPPRDSRDVTVEPSPDPPTSLPGQRSFSGSGDTFSSIEPGDHTYTKLWQAIQTMIASSGQGSRTSLLSTSSGLHSSQQPGAQSLPREGGGKLGAAKASVCTEDIPTLELDGGAGREALHVHADNRRGASHVKESVSRVEVVSAMTGGSYGPNHRLLSPQTSAGRLNVLASQGTLDRRVREKGTSSGGEPASPQQVLPTFSLNTSLRDDGISPSRPVFFAPPLSARQSNPGGGHNENVHIAASDEHHLLVPMDGVSDVHTHTHTHGQLHAFPRVPPRPSLRKMASRQSLRAMRSDVSMRTAGSLSHSLAGSGSGHALPLDDTADLSGILEEAKSDVAMRTASGHSSSHGHGHQGNGGGPGGGQALELEVQVQNCDSSTSGYSDVAQEAMQQRALVYGKRRRRESGRLL